MKNTIFNSKSISLDIASLLLRIVFGLSMAFEHGLGKLLKMLDGDFAFKEVFGLSAGISLGLAVFAEFFCSIFLVLGFATRLVLIPLIITMAVAVFDVHWNDEFSHMEKALLYLTAYISLLLIGSGKWSFDKKLGQ